MIFLTLRSDVERWRASYTLDDVRITLAFEWLPRSGSWYVSIFGDNGVAIETTNRVTPTSPIARDQTNPALPPGLIMAIGPDPYRRDQLGTDVTIVYASAAEVAAL